MFKSTILYLKNLKILKDQSFVHIFYINTLEILEIFPKRLQNTKILNFKLENMKLSTWRFLDMRFHVYNHFQFKHT